MNRRVTQNLASALVAAVLTGAIVASPAVAGDRDTRHETLIFHDITTASVLADLNHNGTPDPGDTLIFHEQDRHANTLIESNDSQCIVALADNYLCHVIVTVTGRGEVTLDGAVHAPGSNFPSDFDLGITGGTGDFARARGYGHAHQISNTAA